MPLSRRSFLATGGPRAAAFPAIAERGREAEQAASRGKPAPASRPPIDPNAIRLDSNENPLGPGPQATEALTKAFEHAGRYPSNARPNTAELREVIARKLSVRPENVVIGNGSRELLRIATRVYTSSSRHLITASPSFEAPEGMAEALGIPVVRVPVDDAGRLDVDKMGEAARWSGLVFFCNPNNPTGVVHPATTVRDFVARVRRESPETAILIDEAYHDYVDDPGYATAVGLALEHPNLIVTRTLSKAYGMAGLRVGYAIGQARTIEAMQRWIMTFTTNSLAQAAAVAALQDQAHIDQERARNSEARAFTTRFFNDLGFRTTESQANFVFVELGRPAKDFREGCAAQGVLVGREFPPLEKTWARVSVGTMDEMQKAIAILGRVLAAGGTNAGGARPQAPDARPSGK